MESTESITRMCHRALPWGDADHALHHTMSELMGAFADWGYSSTASSMPSANLSGTGPGCVDSGLQASMTTHALYEKLNQILYSTHAKP